MQTAIHPWILKSMGVFLSGPAQEMQAAIHPRILKSMGVLAMLLRRVMGLLPRTLRREMWLEASARDALKHARSFGTPQGQLPATIRPKVRAEAGRSCAEAWKCAYPWFGELRNARPIALRSAKLLRHTMGPASSHGWLRSAR